MILYTSFDTIIRNSHCLKTKICNGVEGSDEFEKSTKSQ
jgi:hypothetical protein